MTDYEKGFAAGIDAACATIERVAGLHAASLMVVPIRSLRPAPTNEATCAHPNIDNYGECNEGCCDLLRCKDCGKTWRKEVAQ